MTFLTDHREVVRMRERESRAFLDLTLDERVSFAHLMSHEANEWRELSAVHVLDLIKQVGPPTAHMFFSNGRCVCWY